MNARQQLKILLPVEAIFSSCDEVPAITAEIINDIM